jgi:hypothetical protein
MKPRDTSAEEQLEIREDDLSGSQTLELLRLHLVNQFLHLPL